MPDIALIQVTELTVAIQWDYGLQIHQHVSVE